MRKLIIVTGAAGFIGSCLVRHFNDNGFDDLILVDDLDDQKWKNLVGKSFLDIFSKDKLFDYLKNYFILKPKISKLKSFFFQKNTKNVYQIPYFYRKHL